MTQMKNRPTKSDQLELTKSLDRMGDTPAQAMEWVLNALQINLAELSEGDWQNLTIDLHYLPYRSGPLAAVWQLTSLQQPSHNWVLPNVSRQDAKDWQEEAKKMVHQLGETGRVLTPEVTVSLQIDRTPQNFPQTWPQASMHPRATSPLECLHYAFAHLLAMHAQQIKKCTACSRLFLADRTNKEYCSHSCQARAATRRRRGAPPDQIGRRGRPPKTEKGKSTVSKSRVRSKEVQK
jgi:hypothetical protein